VGFSGRGAWWGTIVLLCAGVAAAKVGRRDSIEMTVVVNDSVQVPPAVLRQAEVEAERIFALSGIQIRWLACAPALGTEDPCQRVPGENEFVVHIVRTGQTSLDSIFGVAFVGQDGNGKYCDIYFDRIQETVRTTRAGLGQLLATAIAHELGHLLLGSHSHSFFGIMMPQWNPEELQRIAMGDLLFNKGEALRMRMRLQSQRRETQDIAFESRKQLEGGRN
jgi:hypothetical protein